MEFVFAVFANDEIKSLKSLEKEEIGVEDTLTKLNVNEELDFYCKYNLDMDTLIRRIREYQDKITWFHFSGHHNEGLGLQLHDGDFDRLFENLEKCKYLKGIFINGCSSASTTEKFKNIAPIYIGTPKPIYDGLAATFSVKFYEYLDTIEKWNDFEHIHSTFNLVKGNIETLLKTNKIKDTERGGGNIKALNSDYYLISDKTDSNKELFENRMGQFYELRIREIKNPNALLEEKIKELSKTGHVDKYHEEVPYIFHKFIKALDARGKFVGSYSHNRDFGSARCSLIRNYFYSYLDLCRYSILSILWDEISKKEFQIPKEDVLDLLVSNKDYSEWNINILEGLCDNLILVQGTENEKQFISSLKPSFLVLDEGIKLFRNEYSANPNSDEVYYKCEILLYNLLKSSKFLNNYHIRSVYSKYYLKHRNDEKPQYVIESLERKGRNVGPENSSGFELINVHSVYLCHKESDHEIVINLSPFYFDRNSDFPNAKKIDLYTLDLVDNETENLVFEYLPIVDPSLRHYSEEENKLLVQIDGIADDSSTTFKGGAIAKRIQESKRLYAQLTHFVELLTE